MTNAEVVCAVAANAGGLPLQTRGSRGNQGFTLMEVMVVVTIAAILMAVAIPSFTTFTKTARLRSASQGLYEALAIARSEAIKRNADVTVSAASGEWKNGWSVKFGTTVLKTWEPERDVSFAELPAATPVDDITYQLSGRITGTREIVAYVSSDNKIPARCIAIDASGRVNTRLDKDGDPSNGC